ncbi:MAG: hypothetical protein IAG13_01940 [Deltaproteobacteria bacterium]|nr:hypothetical protein [Nannocystaceae bacterium]
MTFGAWLVGCGPSSEAAQDCDAELVRMIELEASERFAAVVPLGEAVAIAVDQWTDTGQYPARIVAVDGCGEQPRVVAEGIESREVPPRAELPWLVRYPDDAEEPGTWLVDPWDQRAPHRMSDGEAELVAWTERGVVITRTVDQKLELVSIDLAGVTPSERVLHGAIGGISSHLRDEVRTVVVDDGSDVLAFDVATGSYEVVAKQAEATWVFGDTAAFVRCSPRDRSQDFVVERATGRITMLGREGVTSLRTTGFADGLFVHGDSETQLLMMPEGVSRWLPGSWYSAARSDDGTWLLANEDGLHRLDPDATSPVKVAAEQGIVFFAVGRFYFAQDKTTGAGYPSFRVLRTGADGTAPVDFLGKVVHDLVPVGPGRWAYLADYDDATVELQIRDEDDGGIHAIARGELQLQEDNEPRGWAQRIATPREHVLFSELTPTGNSLWRARLP